MHGRKTKRALSLLPLALGLGLSWACTTQQPTAAEEKALSSPKEDPLQALQATDHTHPMDVHWVTHDSFKEMADGAGLIVQAKVVASRPAVQRVYGWNEKAQRYYTAEEAGDTYAETPLTISTLAVSDVARAGQGLVALGGSDVTPGSKIEVVELGGVTRDGHLMEPGDKPVLRREEEAVFFLIPASNHPGAYHVLGGWQGRLRVVAGTVRALGSEVHPGLSEFSVHDGREARALMDELRAERR